MRNVSAFQPKGATGLNRGLVSYWRLDESSGNASDSVGSNTLTNTSVTYAAGKINNGAVFNGSSSNLQTSTAIPSGAFTIAHYFKTSSASQQVMFNFPNTAGGSGTQGYMLINAGNITAITGSGGSLSSPASTYADGNFHLLTFTVSGGTGYLYIDGSQVATGACTDIAFNWYPILGKNNNGNFFSGTLDEVGIWNRALSATEVTELYNSTNGIQLPSQSLSTKAYYPLNGNSRDFSGNTNTGTDTAITYPQGRFGQGAKFNGSSSKITISNITSLNSGVALTYSCFAKLNALASFKALVSKAQSADGNNRTIMGQGGSVNGDVWVQVSNGSNSYGYSSKVLKTDKFYNLVMVYDGSQSTNATRLKLYIDGVQETLTFSGTIPATMTASTYPHYIGSENAGGGFIDAIIDEVIIESRAWTAKEVETYYRKSTLNYRQKTFAQALIAFLISETVTLTESISTLRTRLFSVAETTTLTEAWTTARGKLFSILETVSTSESFTASRTFVFSVAETVGLTEVLVSVRKKWTNLTKSISTWTNGSKNASTFTNPTKNDSDWTNTTKS